VGIDLKGGKGDGVEEPVTEGVNDEPMPKGNDSIMNAGVTIPRDEYPRRPLFATSIEIPSKCDMATSCGHNVAGND